MSMFISRSDPPANDAPSGLRWFARTRLMPEAIAFQDPIDEICAEPAPALLRGAHYLVVALFATLLLIGGLTKVDVVVVATGRLTTASAPIVLQPMERAIIRRLHVRPGDSVAKGQLLATLDPTFADADSATLERQLASLRAQARRLEAEAEARPFAAGPAGGSDELLQEMLHRQRQAEYATRLQVFDQDVARLRANLQTLGDGRLSLNRELEVARAVEGMRSELVHLQSGSKLNLLEAQASRLRAERAQQEMINRLPEIQHAMESRAAERQAFVDGWRRELLESLIGVRAETARLSSALAKASRLQDLVMMTAPADGVVLDVAARTEGSVLREAEPLITLIPRDAVLIAEVMIASSDVGYTSIGADTQIKIDAYPYQRHGVAAGLLKSVSEESFAPNGTPDTPSVGRGGAFHRGRIALTETQLDHLPADARLFPGMTVTAEIKSGTRSVLSFFLHPLTRGFSESVREP